MRQRGLPAAAAAAAAALPPAPEAAAAFANKVSDAAPCLSHHHLKSKKCKQRQLSTMSGTGGIGEGSGGANGPVHTEWALTGCTDTENLSVHSREQGLRRHACSEMQRGCLPAAAAAAALLRAAAAASQTARFSSQQFVQACMCG